MPLRLDELQVSLPSESGRWSANEQAAKDHIFCEPRVICVAMDSPREKVGPLFIPDVGARKLRHQDDVERMLDAECDLITQTVLSGIDPSDRLKAIHFHRESRWHEMQLKKEEQAVGNLQERLRADCGTIVSRGTNTEPLELGQRVLVRGYHGLWMDIETPSGYCLNDARFYGIGWPIEFSVIALYDEVPIPLWDWLVIERDKPDLLVANERGRMLPTVATVHACGPDSPVNPGDRVAISGNPEQSLTFSWDNGAMEGLEMVKSTDIDGKLQVWSIL